MPRKDQSVWSVQRLSRLLAFLTRSEGSQPPLFRGCCWDAQSPSPRARGGVVVRRSPTDRGRRRGAPGSTDGRVQTWTWWAVGVCHDDMFQHRCQCNCWSFFRRGLWYNCGVYNFHVQGFFGTTQVYKVVTSFYVTSISIKVFEVTLALPLNQRQTWLKFLTFYGSCSHLSGQAPSTQTYGTVPHTRPRYAVPAPLRSACSFATTGFLWYYSVVRTTSSHKVL